MKCKYCETAECEIFKDTIDCWYQSRSDCCQAGYMRAVRKGE